MKLYVLLEEYAYEGATIVGIYSNLGLAQMYERKYQSYLEDKEGYQYRCDRHGDCIKVRPPVRAYLDIEEWELDEYEFPG